MIEILLGVTTILTLTLSWTTYNQFQKVERLEDWIENYSARLIQTKNVLDELDSEGKFASDDEIGTVFEGIKDTINDAKNNIKVIPDESQNEKNSLNKSDINSKKNEKKTN